jgi:NTE family protein
VKRIMKKLGLALGGGGLKGLAHIGILQILAENRIPVFSISGTSIGSLIAALLASGMSPWEMERIALEARASDYIDYNITGALKYILSLYLPGYRASFDGILKGKKLEKMVYRLTGGKTLKDVIMPLSIIACDIDSGREIIFTNQIDPPKIDQVIYVKNALLSEAVRCSTAIPATFVPRKIYGWQAVDGGLKSMVPVKAQKMMGAEYILAVNLGQETYQEKVAGIPQIVSRAIDILGYETSDWAEGVLSDMILFPKVNSVTIFNPQNLGQVIYAGRKAMEDKVEELLRKLKQ